MATVEKVVPIPIDKAVDIKAEDGAEIYIDPAVQRRALRKFDYFVLPQIMILSIIGYMDRSNLDMYTTVKSALVKTYAYSDVTGNAKVFGFEEGANLHGNQFNAVSTVFYATYIVFEILWTLALKHFGSNNILAILLVGWSLVTLCTGFIHTYGQAIAVRVLLDVFESALSPCLAVTMSTIWDRDSIGWRISLLYVANALSGAFGGLIAYGIQTMGEQHGLAAWRWLFIVEGCVSMVLCGLSWFPMPKNAETAWFLSTEEKEMMQNRKRLYALYKGSDKFEMKYLKMAFTDPVIFLGVLCSLGASVGLFGYTTFLPTILDGLGCVC